LAAAVCADDDCETPSIGAKAASTSTQRAIRDSSIVNFPPGSRGLLARQDLERDLAKDILFDGQRLAAKRQTVVPENVRQDIDALLGRQARGLLGRHRRNARD